MIYRGSRELGSDYPTVVVGTGEPGSFERLRHHVKHSPTGFEWGYGGSGPSDLARCILVHHFDAHGLLMSEGPEAPAAVTRIETLYQDFKFDVVAGFGREWTLTSDEIDNWLNERNP